MLGLDRRACAAVLDPLGTVRRMHRPHYPSTSSSPRWACCTTTNYNIRTFVPCASAVCKTLQCWSRRQPSQHLHAVRSNVFHFLIHGVAGIFQALSETGHLPATISRCAITDPVLFLATSQCLPGQHPIALPVTFSDGESWLLSPNAQAFTKHHFAVAGCSIKLAKAPETPLRLRQTARSMPLRPASHCSIGMQSMEKILPGWASCSIRSA